MFLNSFLPVPNQCNIPPHRTVQNIKLNIDIFKQNHPEHQTEYVYLQPKLAITSDWTLIPSKRAILKELNIKTFQFNHPEEIEH